MAQSDNERAGLAGKTVTEDQAEEAQIRAWKECVSMPEELADELRRMDAIGAHDRFYKRLEFGTGGMRGVLGAGTNRMNIFTVRQITRGLGKHLKALSADPSCAVSRDSRLYSREFAEIAAATLADMGVHVYIYPDIRPTPMLSFAVRYLGCDAGVMITASHNPSEFNGYKVYGGDGCQLTPEAADAIQKLVYSEPVLTDSLPDFEEQLLSGRIERIGDDVVEAYYRYILGLRLGTKGEALHVVYSPLNGTGNIPVREIMKRMTGIRVSVVGEQEKPDGNFPTCPYPNPEVRAAMDLCIKKTLETNADLCFATDPDCDRLGAGVRVGDKVELISGNDMGVLMLDYLCRFVNRPKEPKPVVVSTIVSTEMITAMCRKYGIELQRVLTGFKFICDRVGVLEKAGQTERFLFAFEESYGYVSGTEVRDKDGVNAAMLLCDLASVLKKEGKTPLDRLDELRREFGYYAQRSVTYKYEGETGARRMRDIMRGLRRPLEDFNEPEIKTALRTDYLHDETGLPKSDVLEFRLDDDRKFMVRPSGTEPKLKAYLFVRAADGAEAERGLDRLQAVVDGYCDVSHSVG